MNPYGAQICGECGHPLIVPRPMNLGKKLDRQRLSSGIGWKSIGLEKANQRANPFLIKILVLCLFAYGLIIVMLSLATWFKPLYGLDFILIPAHLYPLLLGIFLGAFTLILAFGIYLNKKWVFVWYPVWFGLQVLILFLFLVGWWRPRWFTIKLSIVFSAIILIELLMISFVARSKGRLKLF
jgi:hypothetical protein